MAKLFAFLALVQFFVTIWMCSVGDRYGAFSSLALTGAYVANARIEDLLARSNR